MPCKPSLVAALLLDALQVQGGALHGLWKLGGNFTAPYAEATLAWQFLVS